MHITHGIDIDDLPDECIADCSAQGAVDDAVAHWRQQLAITVDRDRAIACLARYGAWEADELAEWDSDRLAETVLWLACCDFREFKAWREDYPDADTGECPGGSTYFTLE